jgi:hypothetical protein
MWHSPAYLTAKLTADACLLIAAGIMLALNVILLWRVKILNRRTRELLAEIKIINNEINKKANWS